MSAEGTGLQRVETARTESDERFQAIFAQAAVGIAQIGLDGEWQLVNNRFCQMLGYSEAELLTKTLRDITHPDCIDGSMAGRRELLAGEISSHTIEKRYIRKDGSVFWARLNRSVIRDSENRPKCIIAVVEDITDKVEAERALQESEQRFRAAFFEATVGITQCDATGKWVLVNGRFCEIVGYTQAELQTKTVFELTHPDDRQSCIAAVERLLASEIPSYTEEKRYIRKDGSEVWVRVFVKPVWDGDKRLQYFIGVVEDISEKVQAERALRDSEERFRATFFQAAVGIAQTSVQGEWLLVNDRLCEMLGYTHAELLGKTFLEITHPDDREANKAVLHRFLAGEISSGSAEKRYIHKNGGTVWARLNVTLLRDQHHLPLYFISVIEDITDRIQAELALQESERRLMLTLSAGAGVWDCDLRSRAPMLAPQYRGVFGHSPGTLNDWFRLVHPDDRERVMTLVRASVDQAQNWEAEFRLLRPDGSLRWLLSKGMVLAGDDGRPARMLGVSLDITERKHAEAALRESEERFRSMADSSPVMICASGPDKLATFFNKGWLDFTGRSMELELGYGWTDGVHPDDREACLASYSTSFDSHRNCRMEYRLRRADGEYRSVICSGVPRITSDGVFAGYIASCVDITDLRRAQEEALARQKLESLGVLAGGIAHDFNNLLGGILAEAELMEMELSMRSAPLEEIQRIKASATRGAEIVRELMIYAGQDQGSSVEPVDVSRLAAEMLELLKLSISKHAVLKINLKRNLPPVWGSPAQIRQVLMNLIINASEALEEKEGVINVSTEHVRGGKNLTQNGETDLPEGDYVRLEVSDSGYGIAEEARTKIFDPFYTTKFVGRGLGLAVVQGIVRAHGGAINLVTTPGHRTTFQVLLSCASKRSAAIHGVITPALAHQSNAPSGTVLVVEDEELLRLAVSKVLAKVGFSVMEACDGSAAMELIRAHVDDIDLVLLDVTLPGMSSREIFEETQRIRPNLKVVLTSAYSKEAVDASLAGQRVEHFIRKPFQLGDLVNLLRGVLSD